MNTAFLLSGILVLFITGKIAKDWGSGFAGFFYGGILFLLFKLCTLLIRLFMN